MVGLVSVRHWHGFACIAGYCCGPIPTASVMEAELPVFILASINTSSKGSSFLSITPGLLQPLVLIVYTLHESTAQLIVMFY